MTSKNNKKVAYELKSDSLFKFLTATSEFAEMKPHSPNQDTVKGYPKLSSKDQVDRYIKALKIVYDASKDEEIRHLSNSYFNQIMTNAHNFMTKEEYQEFNSRMKSLNIIPNKYT